MAKLEEDMALDPKGTQERIDSLTTQIQTLIKTKFDAYMQAAKR